MTLAQSDGVAQQAGNMPDRNVVNDGGIEREAAVRNQIAQTGRTPAVHLGQRLKLGVGQSLQCFPDNLELEQNRVEGCPVAMQLGHGPALHQPSDLLGTGDQVVEVEQPIT